MWSETEKIYNCFTLDFVTITPFGNAFTYLNIYEVLLKETLTTRTRPRIMAF